MSPRYSFDSLGEHVGQELGVSDWLSVDQAMIDGFAETTGDRQWIHVDVERCRKESPFGGTIAHGFLLLSLLAPLQMRLGLLPDDVARTINAGLGEVRFQAPVPAGGRVRLRVSLAAVEPKGEGRLLMVTRNVLEIDGQDKPALVAEMAALLYR
jgi:acyl dehydratase